jgi:hypothetical protein
MAERLTREHGVNVEVLPADLGAPAGLRAAEARIGELPRLARL